MLRVVHEALGLPPQGVQTRLRVAATASKHQPRFEVAAIKESVYLLVPKRLPSLAFLLIARRRVQFRVTFRKLGFDVAPTEMCCVQQAAVWFAYLVLCRIVSPSVLKHEVILVSHGRLLGHVEDRACSHWVATPRC